MDGILRQEFELIQGLIVLEGPVGIQPQFHLMERETLTDTFDQVQFLIEVDGTDLQFHTPEPLLQFLLHPLQHLLIAAHPHESVDGNPHLTATEGRVEQPIAMLQIQPCRLKSEQHRRIVSQVIIRYLSRLTHRLTHLTEYLLVRLVAHGVAAQIRQRSTFPYPFTHTIRQTDIPHSSLRIHTPRRPRRLLEMQCLLFYFVFIHMLQIFNFLDIRT